MKGTPETIEEKRRGVLKRDNKKKDNCRDHIYRREVKANKLINVFIHRPLKP